MVVTGAGRGIGRVIAKDAFKVVLSWPWAVTTSELKTLKDEIEGAMANV